MDGNITKLHARDLISISRMTIQSEASSNKYFWSATWLYSGWVLAIVCHEEAATTAASLSPLCNTENAW
jgi:hypothetical protein